MLDTQRGDPRVVHARTDHLPLPEEGLERLPIARPADGLQISRHVDVGAEPFARDDDELERMRRRERAVARHAAGVGGRRRRRAAERRP